MMEASSSRQYAVALSVGNNGPVPAPPGFMGLMPAPTGDERCIGKEWYLGNIKDQYRPDAQGGQGAQGKVAHDENQGGSKIFMATGPVADVNLTGGPWTVSYVQKAIQDQTGIPASMQRILQGGKVLEAAVELSSSKALEGCAAGSLVLAREPEETLYIIGGKGEHGDLATVDRFRPLLDSWSPVPRLRPLEQSRCGLQAVALDGFIYAIGGRDSSTGRVLDSLQRFDPIQNAWTSLEPMRSRREFHAAAVLNQKIYVAGGSDGRTALNAVECFDPRTNTWEVLPPLQVRRLGLALVAVGKQLYAIGGQCGDTALRCVEMLDVECMLNHNSEDVSWTLRAPELSVNRSYHTAVVFDGVIYVIGGYGGGDVKDDLCTAEMLGPGRQGWEPIASMGLRRSHHACAVVDGKIYVLGGCRKADCTSRSSSSLHAFRAVDVFNPQTRSWRPAPEMSGIRHDFAAVVL